MHFLNTFNPALNDEYAVSLNMVKVHFWLNETKMVTLLHVLTISRDSLLAKKRVTLNATQTSLNFETSVMFVR